MRKLIEKLESRPLAEASASLVVVSLDAMMGRAEKSALLDFADAVVDALPRFATAINAVFETGLSNLNGPLYELKFMVARASGGQWVLSVNHAMRTEKVTMILRTFTSKGKDVGKPITKTVNIGSCTPQIVAEFVDGAVRELDEE